MSRGLSCCVVCRRTNASNAATRSVGAANYRRPKGKRRAQLVVRRQLNSDINAFRVAWKPSANLDLPYVPQRDRRADGSCGRPTPWIIGVGAATRRLGRIPNAAGFRSWSARRSPPRPERPYSARSAVSERMEADDRRRQHNTSHRAIPIHRSERQVRLIRRDPIDQGAATSTFENETTSIRP